MNEECERGRKKREMKQKANKKWTTEEIEQILQFIQEERDFEKPTAQFYYKKYLKNFNLNVSWELIRWKRRYLKQQYKKAEEWRKSTGAGLLTTDEGISSVKDKLKKICPYYEQLHDIFGANVTSLSFVLLDSATSSTNTSTPLASPDNTVISPSSKSKLSYDFEETTLTSPVPTSTLDATETTLDSSTTTTTCSNINKKKVDRFAEKLKKSAPKTSVDQLALVQKERNALQKLQIELEKEKNVKAIEIKEKRIYLDELKIKAEIERGKQELDLKRQEIEKEERLKMQEIEKDERLRKLEIEKQERIQKFEIEMKYRYIN